MSLYVRVAGELAGRSPEDIASIAHAMQSADRIDDARLLIDTALRARPNAGDSMNLAETLWSVGDGVLASHVVKSSAQLMQDDQATSMLDLLCSGGHGDVALGYCVTVLDRCAPSSAVELVDRLRYLGRPIDANRLLAVLTAMSSMDLAFVVRSLVISGRYDDARRVFNSVQSAEISYKAGLISASVLGNALSEQVDSLIRNYLQSHPDRVAAIVEMLASSQSLEALTKELYVNMFSAFGLAASFYQQLVEVRQADQARLLLMAQLSLVVDVPSAIDMAASFNRFDIGADIAPLLLPLDIHTRPFGSAMFAVAARLVNPSLTWGFTIRQIGENLDEGTVAAMAAELLKQNRIVTAEVLLWEIARHRATEAIPAILQRLSESKSRQGVEILLREIRKQRSKPDRRELAQLLHGLGPGPWEHII